MNTFQKLLQLATVFVVLTFFGCFATNYDLIRLRKDKKAMRNSLVRFGKRAVNRPVFPFYDGFGALRMQNAPIYAAYADAAANAYADTAEREDGKSNSGNAANMRPAFEMRASAPTAFVKQPRIAERYFSPPLFNFFRYRRTLDPSVAFTTDY